MKATARDVVSANHSPGATSVVAGGGGAQPIGADEMSPPGPDGVPVGGGVAPRIGRWRGRRWRGRRWRGPRGGRVGRLGWRPAGVGRWLRRFGRPSLGRLGFPRHPRLARVVGRSLAHARHPTTRHLAPFEDCVAPATMARALRDARNLASGRVVGLIETTRERAPTMTDEPETTPGARRQPPRGPGGAPIDGRPGLAPRWIGRGRAARRAAARRGD